MAAPARAAPVCRQCDCLGAAKTLRAAPRTIENRDLRHARFHEIASSRVFNNVNRNDVRAALKVLFDIVARQRGFLLDSSLDILDSLTEIRERLQSHSTDMLMLAMTDYLELENSRS